MAWPKFPKVPNWARAIFRFRNPIFVILVPLVCLPLALKGGTDVDGKDLTKAMQCAYVLVIMAAYWVTEALPLAITSIIPIILLPMFGIMTTDRVSKEYFKETNVMFMSGIIVAIAVEYSNLHKRIALRFLLLIGTSPRRLMLGLMFITMFLSMWISNTATTAMMVPIVEAVLKVIVRDEPESSTLTLDTTLNGNLSSKESGKLEETESQVRAKRTRHMMFLAVAYAANCGGTGTLTGTGSNLVLKGALSDINNNPINFATWMAFAIVPMLLNIVICWLWLQVYYLGFQFGKIAKFFWRKKSRNDDEEKPTDQADNPNRIRDLLQSHYDDLGFITFHEIAVLTLFILLIILWFFREPEFMAGWGELFPINITSYLLTNSNCTNNCTYLASTLTRDAVDDGSAGMLIVIFLFIVPKTFANMGSNSEALINWKLVEHKMPWELVFLLGGGFALAKGTTESHLSDYLGRQLEALGSLPPWVIVVVVCICTAAATEVTSNVATCSILLPILFDMAISLRINPLYLMLPVTLCCSYAFMLPVATPPNAIVYNASGMNTTEMIKVGFVMNIVCVVTNILWLESFGVYYFELSTFPKWAEHLTSG